MAYMGYADNDIIGRNFPSKAPRWGRWGGALGSAFEDSNYLGASPCPVVTLDFVKADGTWQRGVSDFTTQQQLWASGASSYYANGQPAQEMNQGGVYFIPCGTPITQGGTGSGGGGSQGGTTQGSPGGGLQPGTGTVLQIVTTGTPAAAVPPMATSAGDVPAPAPAPDYTWLLVAGIVLMYLK